MSINPLTPEASAAYQTGFNDAIQAAYAEIRTIEIARGVVLEEVRKRVMALMKNDRD